MLFTGKTGDSHPVDFRNCERVNVRLTSHNSSGEVILVVASCSEVVRFPLQCGKTLKLRKNFPKENCLLSVENNSSVEYSLHIKTDKIKKLADEETVNGTLESRTFNPINSNENTRIHRFDLRSALSATFTLTWDDPTASILLYVYTIESKYNNLNTDAYPSINLVLNPDLQRVTGIPLGETTLIAEFEEVFFTPTKYIVQIVNEESNQEITYQLTVSYTLPRQPVLPSDSNFFVGFWECINRANYSSYRFIQAADGTIKSQRYEGNQFTGFQRYDIYSFSLTAVENGYYDYFGIFADFAFFYYLNNQNSDQLFQISTNRTNPRNIQDRMITYERNDNPNIIDYNSSTQLSTPTALFEDFFRTNFLQNNSQFTKDFQSNDYPGIEKMTELKNLILKEGIIEEFNGTDIWPEMTFFGEEYTTNGVENPIQTYAPEFVDSTFVSADFLFLVSVALSGNRISFRIPRTSFEVNMLVDISGLQGNPAFGLAKQWLDGLYRISEIDNSEEGYSFVSFVQSRITSNRVEFLDYPLYQEKRITITPRCFKLTTEELPRLLPGTMITPITTIVELEGFWETGGLLSGDLNNRFTIYHSNSFSEFFITLPEKTPILENAVGGNSGILKVCTYPQIPSNMYLQNRVTVTCPPAPLTLIYASTPVLVNQYTLVKLSGLAKEYESLNGTYDVHISATSSFNAKINSDIWKDGYYIPNRKHYLPLQVKSNGLPSFNPKVHTFNGESFQIQTIVLPLTDQSLYGDYANACGYLLKKQGVNTHVASTFYIDRIEGTRNPSWERIQYTISNNISLDFPILTRQRDPVSSTVYQSSGVGPLDFNTNHLNANSYGNKKGNSIHVSQRLDVTRSGISVFPGLYYRYVDNSQLRNVYARISGQVLNDRVPGSDLNYQHISNFLKSLGYNANGTLINYETGPFIPANSLFFDLETPEQKRYNLRNAFTNNGFTVEEFSGDLILANPPLANTSLSNADQIAGKIVVIIRGAVSFLDKYNRAVQAGAIGVIIVNSLPGDLPSAGADTPPIDGVMMYTISGIQGNQLTGYNGEGVNDVNNYTLLSTSPTGYFGSFVTAPVLVGDTFFEFGILQSQFVPEGKNIGYINLPNSDMLTPDRLELLPDFWDNYGSSTLLDQYAKMWAAVMITEFDTPTGRKKLSEMDSIIIDNGNNDGGIPETLLTLAAFFGENRPNIVPVYGFNGSGYTPSKTAIQIAGDLPVSSLIDLKYWNDPLDIPCSLYQSLYPEAKFQGRNIGILTSTGAFSAGDMLPHYFRNTQAINPADLGGVTSLLVGCIDGRFQGLNELLLPNITSRTSRFSIAPSITGTTAMMPAYYLAGESLYGYENSLTKENIASQQPEIRIDGINNKGPITAWFEDDGGFYQAFGFSSVYLRNNERYRIFNDVLGFPQPYQPETYHYPYLEDTILSVSYDLSFREK